MLNTILSIQHILVPIIAISLSMAIPLLAIYFYFKHKNRIMDERKLMIEKGIAPPPLESDFDMKSSKNNPMFKGMNMLAVALGILTGYFISVQWHTDDAISIICAILFWLGIANIVKSVLINKNPGNYE